MNWNVCTTLGKEKEFFWKVSHCGLHIKKEIKTLGNVEYIFSKQELFEIIEFINEKEKVKLSNDVIKMKNILLDEYKNDEYYEKGLGPFVYKITRDNMKAQSTSQLVAILVKNNILNYKKQGRVMQFWLNGDKDNIMFKELL